MKVNKVIVIVMIALLFVLASATAGCAQKSAKLVVSPAEVKAASTAKTIIVGSGLPSESEIRVIVLMPDSTSLDNTLLCDPAPEANDRGTLMTTMSLKGFASGTYTVNVTDKDYNTLATMTLRVVAP
ncbi:hypothetical protein ACFLYR_07125 [Chloroflexota bacterium]